MPRNPALTTDPAALTARVKAEATRLGFAACAVLPAAPTATHAFYEAWLAADYAGAMTYLHRHAPLKRDPRSLLPEARSVIVLAHRYDAGLAAGVSAGVPAGAAPADAPATAPARGRVSRYALGPDYHDLLHGRLAGLADFLARQLPHPLRHRACVDSAPLMERELAARAGLGWVGRNALLIHWRHGSWLLLAELLVDALLAPDLPPAPGAGARRRRPDRERPPPLPPAAQVRPQDLLPPLRDLCGSCTACLDACPTGAIVGDRTVDSRRCISYLTIELKGPLPVALRPAIGDWVFGCDVCQEVCPWNRRVPPLPGGAPGAPGVPGVGGAETGGAGREDDPAAPSLVALLGLDDAAFRARYRDTALWRPRRRGLLRNVAVALGNRLAASAPRQPGQPPGYTPDPAAVQALRGALADAEPWVRGAAAWALGQLGPQAPPVVTEWLRAALDGPERPEADPQVRAELTAALAALAGE